MKTALVTGASTGIGKEIALILAKNEFEILLVGRNESRLQELENLIKSAGGRSKIFLTDLSSTESVNSLIDEVKSAYSTVDALVNVAGIWHGESTLYANTSFQNFSQDIILSTLQVGLTSPMLLVHGLLQLMKANAKVINISGTFETGAKGWLPYFVSKRAIEDFTVGLAEELADKEIQVNCISPSDTKTESYAKYFPEFIADAIEPTEIAMQVLLLCDVSNTETGRIFVMKKNEPPTEKFHA